LFIEALNGNSEGGLFSKMDKLDFVAIGHLIKETIEFPEKRVGPILGSPVAYSSVTAAKLGMKVGMVTKIGKDMPEDLLKPLAEVNVNKRGIKIGEETTTNLLIYDRLGNKRIEYLKRAPDIFFEDIPTDYLKAEIIFICPMNYEVLVETVKTIRKKSKATLAVDLGGYGGAASSKHPRDLKFLKKLVGYFDIVKVSSEDCRHLFLSEEISYPKKIADLLIKWGASIGIVTLGEKGCIVATKTDKFEVPTLPNKAVDCTGAGDVFCAGFLAEYLKTKDARKSALFANVTSSLVVESTGGVTVQRMPTSSMVYEKIKAFDAFNTS
jgi:sugar/nucleoside kinase (ribokinase family)